MLGVRLANLCSIRADEALPLEVFARAVGMGRHGIRSLRRQGLPVRRIAGRGYVLGKDWIQLLAGLASTGSEAGEEGVR